MATIGTLIVNIQLNNQQYLAQINRTTQATNRAMQQMQHSVGGLDRAFLMLRRTFLSFFALSTATRAAKDIANYADAWKLATNQISAANSIASLQARSMENINRLAAETRTSLADTAELYARLLRSTEGVAKSEDEVAEATRIVSMAFKAGGASMQEAANGARQLGQSLASGIFQGDELRSIRENAPLLAQAIATEFNTTIGGLKALGAEGKLTADRVFKAILENSKPIKDAFAATNSTIAESFTVLNNSIAEYIGELDKATGFSKSFTKSILDLAKALADASKAPTGTSALSNAQQDLNILWTAAAKKINELNEAYEEATGRSSKFTSNTKEQITTLAAWTHPVTAQMKMLELLRIAYEKLSGAVETYVSTQTMTGRGSALARPQPVPLPKMPKVPEEILALKDELRDQKRLTEVVSEGADAYKELEDRIEAENETLKKYGSLRSEVARQHLAISLAIKAETRATEALRDARVLEFRAGGGRTGVGAPGAGVVPVPGGGRLTMGGRTGIPEARFPTQEAREFSHALELSSENWQRMKDAALAGSDALRLTKDAIDAENDALAAGHIRGTTAYDDAVRLGVVNRQLARSVEEVTEAFGEMESVQRNIDQQKELQAALRISVVAFNEASMRIEAFNFALAKGGDGTTEFERGLASLKYEELKTKEATDKMTESFSKIPEMINSTITSAISSVSSAFADAVVEGENFRDMLDALLKDLAKLAINSVMNLFLRQMIGTVATPGTAGTGMLGGMGFHSGGIVGSEGKHRMIPASLIATAPRLHDGLMSNEFAAVLKKGEGVFTPDQMDALGGKTVNNFTVINQAPNTDVTEQRRENSSGGMDVTAIIRQVMTKEAADPGSTFNKTMKSNYGLSQTGIRR